MNNLNSSNSIEPKKQLSKTQKFVENTKKAVKDALTRAGIAVSTMAPMTPTTTATFVPTTANTITAVAPTVSTVAKTISLGAAASLLAACSDGSDDPIDVSDKTPPTINVLKSEIDITGGKEVIIKGNQLYIGNDLVASWTDDKSKNCAVLLSINGKTIPSGTTISEEGTLNIKVSDEAGNIKTTDVKLNMVKNAPSITVNQYEVNIFGGVTVNIDNNKLLFGDEVIASRNDDNLESCKVELSFNGQNIKAGDTINEPGTLSIKVTNKNSKTSTAEITLTNDAIYGLETLKNATMKVDEQIDLLNGITFAEGIELVKTEIEMDGNRNTIPDPNHYVPAYPGTCSIIFTLKGKNEENSEIKVDNLTIKPLDYKAMEVTNIKPVDILPIIGQVEAGDKKCYEHIEHLRVAEATRIRDMMWEYGAGNHSAEEYQKLMMRLNTGMRGELPFGYNNYEIIGEGTLGGNGSLHAHIERSILCALLNHTNLKLVNESFEKSRQSNLMDFIQNNPNSINIFGSSSYTEAYNKADYDERLNKESIKDLCKSKKFIIFSAGTNIETQKNKIYNGEYEADEHGMYSLASLSNSDKNTQPNSHLLVTIATNKDGNIDQTDVNVESSKYPVGFKDNVLFSGRGFPQHREGVIFGPSGRYTTSDTNYFNVALADLCFQMFAEVGNVDKLLEMIRSTALTDRIRLDLNGDGDTNDSYQGQPETQPLQLINPAGFFQKYNMPTSLPTSIQTSKTAELNKGYYKGVIFAIPGAEVKIDGEWVAYNDANKSKIKSQNPMDLEWRLNGDLLRKLGYKGKTVNGKIIVVDDKWNGLNIDKEFSISVQ